MMKNFVNPQNLHAKIPHSSSSSPRAGSVVAPGLVRQQRRVMVAKNLATGQIKQVLERKSEMIARQIDRQKLR